MMSPGPVRWPMWAARRSVTLGAMKLRIELALGILLVIGGGCLWLFARDAEFFWFRGGPLGVVLVIVGIFDVANALRTDRLVGTADSPGSTHLEK